MLYDPDDVLLILINHGEAFDAGIAVFGHSPYTGLTVGKQWQTALRELDDNALQAELGGVLDERRLAGLMQRRDALLSNSND